jgi:hypothetical protein
MAAMLALLVIAFRLTGRLWWCKCGQFFLYSGDINSMHNSQHLIDAYSISHVLHGILFFYAIHLCAKRLSITWKIAMAMVIETGWEILENSPLIIDRYRAGTIAVGYEGDTVANGLSDVVMALLGFMLARYIGWKGSLAFFVASELFMLWWIRDNLTLNVLMILWPIPAVREWQAS